MDVAAWQPTLPYSALAKTTPAGAHLSGRAPDVRRSALQKDVRRSIGEFVGGVFYGMILKQMQASPFKTKYLSGGRAEEAFAGQLALELSKRLGRSVSDPVANKMYASFAARLGIDAAPDAGVTETAP